jgi:hypothetical protein
MLTIYNKFEIPPKYSLMNKTILNLALDCLELNNFQELEEYISSKSESWRYDIGIPEGRWSDDLFTKLFEFTEYHLNNPIDLESDKLTFWDVNYMKDVKKLGDEALYYLYELADFLENEQLINVCAIYIAQNEIVGYSAEELRKKFKLKNDFTDEEIEDLKNSLAWIDKIQN